jgi:hypothetical protein
MSEGEGASGSIDSAAGYRPAGGPLPGTGRTSSHLAGLICEMYLHYTHACAVTQSALAFSTAGVRRGNSDLSTAPSACFGGGKATSTQRPPPGEAEAVIVAPWAVAIARTMEKPRP